MELILQLCGRKERNPCNEPLKFKPANGNTAKYILGYEDLPLEKDMFPPAEIAKHEEAIFHEESKRKVLNGLGEDILNLHPTKIT